MKYQYNPITFSDTYKVFGHWDMLPSGVETLQSYFESRVGAKFPFTQFVGLQAYIKHFLLENPVTKEHLEQAQDCAEHHVFDRNAVNIEGWKKIIDKFGGYAPIKISAVPEGGCYPIDNMLYRFDSEPEFAWVNGHFETMFLNLWATFLCATVSKDAKNRFIPYWEETVGHTQGLEYGLHDFGARSVSCPYSQGFVGMGHLVNFMGTDTVAALDLIAAYYQNGSYEGIGYSVKATEHSISTLTGMVGERDDYLGRILKKYPHGIVSIVADTYGINQFVSEYIPHYKKVILDRWRNGAAPINKTVIRPDSLRHTLDTPEDQTLWIVQQLDKTFGSTRNNKGYKELHPCCGVLWGDGIDTDGCVRIYQKLRGGGYAANNVVFGMGGKLLNSGTRDTQRSAFKASYAIRDGKSVKVVKNPQDNMKASKGGNLKLIRVGNGYRTVANDSRADVLQPVYQSGKLLRDTSWSEIRSNS